MDIVVEQKLLKHLPGGDEEITVAPLAPEFEGEFGRCFSTRATITRAATLNVGNNGNLQLTLNTLNQIVELRQAANTGEVGAWRYGHVSLERNMILSHG